jgi:hypothetical protein
MSPAHPGWRFIDGYVFPAPSASITANRPAESVAFRRKVSHAAPALASLAAARSAESVVLCGRGLHAAFTGACQRTRQDLQRSWGTAILLLPCSPTAAGPAAAGHTTPRGNGDAAEIYRCK